MEGKLEYEDAVRLLRRALVETTGNARAFRVRARGRPQLVSARSWRELSEIENLLAHELFEVLRRELRVEPWKYFMRIRAGWRGISLGIRGEASVVTQLYRESSQAPVDAWRTGAPQVEELWSFLCPRTHHLANTLALALGEPSPYPALFWHPGQRNFKS